jgi:hypothetical protein
MHSHGTHSSNTGTTSNKKCWPLLSIPSLPGAVLLLLDAEPSHHRLCPAA